MKIETKYNLNQEVWFMEDNKIVSEKILELTYSISSGLEKTFYHFEDSVHQERKRLEYQVFSTKEELISSL